MKNGYKYIVHVQSFSQPSFPCSKNIMMLLTLLILSSVGLAAAADPSLFSENDYSPDNIVNRDVLIVGGGAAGTHAAVRLKDLGKSFTLVEKSSVLGGHTHTYIDPTTGTPVEFGVHSFGNTSDTRDFFARFEIPLVDFVPARFPVHYIDFNTGDAVAVALDTNVTGYLDQVEKYPSLAYGWLTSFPVPSDLLLSFGDFVNKYSLQKIVYTIYYLGVGIGNILQQLTITVMNSVGVGILSGLQGVPGGAVVPAAGNNHAIFDKALAELRADILLNSHVVAASRPANNSGVKVVVQTPNSRKLVLAKRIIVAVLTQPENMNVFSPDEREARLFSQLKGQAFYVGLVTNTGLPVNQSYYNAASSEPDNVPLLPKTYNIQSTVLPGVFWWLYGSETALTEAAVKTAVTSQIATVRRALNVPAPAGSPQFLAFGNHTPTHVTVPAEAIASGFYRDLYGLQGYRNTWYTGAQFIDSASGIWNLTNAVVLPGLLTGL